MQLKNQSKKSKRRKKIKKKSLSNHKKLFGRIYISYTKRYVIFLLLFILFFSLGIYFILNSTDIVQEENIFYQEKSNIDYSVCLNNNDFYEEKCLAKDMSYIASLINKISLDFNYQFMTNKETLNQPFEYEILAKLVIANNDTNTNYFEKKYTLVEKTSNEVKKMNKYYTLNKQIDIDYNTYNEIANRFKSQYGIDTNSYLEIYLITYNKSSSEYTIPSSSVTSLQIPLSQKAIQIKLNAKELNTKQNQLVTRNQFLLSNIIYLILGTLCILFSIIYILTVIKMSSILGKKKNEYDKYLSKILKEYDRLIVETSTYPKIEDYHLLKINSFDELLDVRDNLRLPIMYYNVTPHQKSHFYILQEKNLYLYTLKLVDLTKEKN